MEHDRHSVSSELEDVIHSLTRELYAMVAKLNFPVPQALMSTTEALFAILPLREDESIEVRGVSLDSFMIL